MKNKRLNIFEITLTRIDILILCYYYLNISKNKKKYSKITTRKIVEYLSYIDYNYYKLQPTNVRDELRLLFPIKINNHLRTKYFKINNSLILFWGKKFDINYNQHNYFFETYKRIENETLSF
jgi:hypothetical protein